MKTYMSGLKSRVWKLQFHGGLLTPILHGRSVRLHRFPVHDLREYGRLARLARPGQHDGASAHAAAAEHEEQQQGEGEEAHQGGHGHGEGIGILKGERKWAIH